MRVYLTEWPNGTISVLTADNEVDLFDQLDSEGDPTDAKIYLMPTRFHIETDVKNGIIEPNELSGKGEPKEFRFSDDIFERVYF